MRLEPEDELLVTVRQILNHPVMYGVGAGIVRFIVGDKTAGWKALIANILISMFVALGVMYYLTDEPYTEGKKTFLIIVASFLARDLLITLLSIGAQISENPAEFFARLQAALKGGRR